MAISVIWNHLEHRFFSELVLMCRRAVPAVDSCIHRLIEEETSTHYSQGHSMLIVLRSKFALPFLRLDRGVAKTLDLCKFAMVVVLVVRRQLFR